MGYLGAISAAVAHGGGDMDPGGPAPGVGIGGAIEGMAFAAVLVVVMGVIVGVGVKGWRFRGLRGPFSIVAGRVITHGESPAGGGLIAGAGAPQVIRLTARLMPRAAPLCQTGMRQQGRMRSL